MNETTKNNFPSISEMKNRVLSFNKEFEKNEVLRDQLNELLSCLVKASNQKKFMSASFEKSLNDEIKVLKEKLKINEIDSIVSFFAEVAHYVWTHPDKKEKLIVDAELQRGYSGQELEYSFSGELGDLFRKAIIPFNTFGFVWFIDYKNKTQKLYADSSWEDFCAFFVKHFCDQPNDFKEAFKKIMQ